MRSAAQAEHSHHHQHGRHPAPEPGELKRLAVRATLRWLAGGAVGEVRR
jgi:hypothetical protein